MTAHTTVQKGKRVLIRMQNGEWWTGKFKQKTGSWVEIETQAGEKRLWAGKIKSMKIVKVTKLRGEK